MFRMKRLKKLNKKFFKDRIQFAYDFRKTVERENITNCRLIFGEADQFSGLVIDRFNDVLVAEVNSLGIERIKDFLFNKLVEVELL